MKFALILFGIYHLFAGSIMLTPHDWIQKFGKKVYRLEIPLNIDPRYFICLKFLGLMAIMVGCLSLLVSYSGNNQVQELALVFYAILFIMRSIFRALYKKEFFEAYKLDFNRSKKNIILNVLLALLAIVLAWISYASL